MSQTYKSKSVEEKKRALFQGAAWIFGAIVVGFVDLRLLAIPPLGVAGLLAAGVMAIIGIRRLQRGLRLGPYDLLALASEKEAGVLNAATIVQAFGCTPESARRAMNEGLRANLFEDVTPPTAKAMVIRSLATENLAQDVQDGEEALQRAMRRLDAELVAEMDPLQANLNAASTKDASENREQGDSERE